MNKLNPGTRILTMLLDHFAMSLLMMLIVLPSMLMDMAEMFKHPNTQPPLFFGNYYLFAFAFSLYFNKDIYLGRSLSKRIFKFQVVNFKTNKVASPLRCLVRNLTIVFWPIEAIVALIDNERRIGDYLAGTKLTIYNPEIHAVPFNWLQAIASLLIAVFVTYFAIFYPMELFFQSLGEPMH
jgi:uncharacterized RDD family membrane protein YckC